MATFGVFVAPCIMRGVWGDPPPILGAKLAPCVMRGVWGDHPPILGRNWSLARGLGVGWACPAHLYLILCPQVHKGLKVCGHGHTDKMSALATRRSTQNQVGGRGVPCKHHRSIAP